MTITFLGASGGVTGSCYLLEHKGKTILVDCGMFQGADGEGTINNEPFSFPVSELSAVLLTHAHLDHCGRLPMLLSFGFHGKIYMTEATKAIAEVGLLDAARVSKEHLEHGSLYSESDVYRFLDMVEVIAYDREFAIADISIIFRDAGHILGSSSIELAFHDATGQVKGMVFSGDLGNSPSDLLQPTEMISSSDVVIMESTYGNELHPEEDIDAIISSEINTVEANRGVLLIPVFSIDRAQMLLHRLNHLKHNGSIQSQTSVFFDTPMGLAVTRIYERFPQLFSQELATHAKRENPFDFPGLHIVEESHHSDFIREMTGPKVIIAGSGMMSGGRIMRHAAEYLPKSTTRLLIVGYQAEDTMGSKLLHGAKNVEIDGEMISVAATVAEIKRMSAHADQKGLLEWLKHIQGVKTVILVHGDEDARQAMKVKLEAMNPNLSILLPEKGDMYPISSV